MAAVVRMTVKPHWISAWWLRMTARPYVRIDGVDRRVAWSSPSDVAVEPGEHTITAGIRYRGFAPLLGTEDRVVDVADGEVVSFTAQNGILNGDPFTVRPTG